MSMENDEGCGGDVYADDFELWKPEHHLEGKATLRTILARAVTIEASGEDPERVLWDLAKKGIALLEESKRTSPYGLRSSPQAEIEIATEHYTITVKWTSEANPRVIDGGR